MHILHHKQGTPEWHAHRLTHFNASDAPAMMGCSKYKTRAQLVREIATGLSADVSAETQQIFDAGHAYEKLARPLAEAIIGEDLYPMTGYEGALSASFDGLTLDDRIAWEHKSLNDALRAVLPESTDGIGDDSIGAQLPLMYCVQMEQQAYVSNCERVLFTASKWHGEDLVECRHCWYRPDPELRTQILAGWNQFELDVAAYQPSEVAAAVVAEPVQALPAVMVKVTGEVAITSNFNAFEIAFRDFLEHRLIREPKTDQDFADLDQQIKAMKGAEAALESAEAQMLAQIASVDTATKTKEMLHHLVRSNRLTAEKLLESEKQRRKAEIVGDGQAKLREHLQALTARARVAVFTAADFPGVIKGKKSLASMEDAISTELARAKIEASRIADLIQLNRAAMGESSDLFPDFAQVCTKSADDFANLVTSRKAAAAQRLEAQREQIRREEAARLEREAKERQEAADRKAKAEAEELDRREREALAALERQRAEAAKNTPSGDKAGSEPAREVMEPSVCESAAGGSGNAAPALATLPHTASPDGGPMGARQPAAAGPSVAEVPTLKLGEINARIAPLSITADGLEQLGFPATKVKAACMYRHSAWPAIHTALMRHLAKAQAALEAA